MTDDQDLKALEADAAAKIASALLGNDCSRDDSAIVRRILRESRAADPAELQAAATAVLVDAKWLSVEYGNRAWVVSDRAMQRLADAAGGKTRR